MLPGADHRRPAVRMPLSLRRSFQAFDDGLVDQALLARLSLAQARGAVVDRASVGIAHLTAGSHDQRLGGTHVHSFPCSRVKRRHRLPRAPRAPFKPALPKISDFCLP